MLNVSPEHSFKTKFDTNFALKEQPFIFAVYLMNHIFQTSALFKRDNRLHRTELIV